MHGGWPRGGCANRKGQFRVGVICSAVRLGLKTKVQSDERRLPILAVELIGLQTVLGAR